MDLKNGAKRVCKTKFEDANTTYPLIGQKALPYACLDLIYMYTLLVDGFGKFPLSEVYIYIYIYSLKIKLLATCN